MEQLFLFPRVVPQGLMGFASNNKGNSKAELRGNWRLNLERQFSSSEELSVPTVHVRVLITGVTVQQGQAAQLLKPLVSASIYIAVLLSLGNSTISGDVFYCPTCTDIWQVETRDTD